MNSSSIYNEITNTNLHNQSHTGFTFNGNCVLDSIYIENETMDDTDILNTSVSILPEWTPNVIFLASMNNTVDASNVSNLTGSVTSWILYRQELNADIMYKVCEVTPNITSWIDYKAEGNKTYVYYIYAQSDTQISEPIITDEFKTNFYGYYLISSDADSSDPGINDNVQVFKFDLNVTSDKVINNNNAIYLKNFTKYDTVITLPRDFRSGSFTSSLIPFDINGNYDFEGNLNWADYLESLHILLASSDYKYIKNREGQIIMVSTTNTSQTSHEHTFDENLTINGQKLINVTIYYNEIGDSYANN